MVKRLIDLVLITVACAFLAWLWPTQEQPAKGGLPVMHLEILESAPHARGALLRLTVTNPTSDPVQIPGTFCQAGSQDPTWFSHAVKVKVNDYYFLGPAYGDRELHEHPTRPLTLGPAESRHWDLRLSELIALGGEKRSLPRHVVCYLGPDLHSNPVYLRRQGLSF